MIRLGAALLAAVTLATAGWHRAAPLPLARSEVAAARYGNGIVIVGGYIAGGTGNTARADLFFPGQNRWRRLPDFPLPIDHAAGVGARGRAYVLGGFDKNGAQTRAAHVLDNGRWKELPKLPVPRAASGAAIVGNKLYLVGGFGGEKLAKDMLVFDLASRRWSAEPGPTPRDHLGVTAVNGRIYAVGGEKYEPGREVDLVESWAPGERSWKRLPPISGRRSGVVVTPVGGALVAAGGTNLRRPFATVQRLQPGSKSWSSLPRLRTARHSFGLVLVGKRLYAIGGGQYSLSVSSANEYLTVR